MSEKPTPDNQTILLIDAFLQGTISDQQQAELERLLASDSEQRQLYIDYMQVHNGLTTWTNETTEPATWIPQPASETQPSQRKSPRFLLMLVSSLVAATLLLSLAYYAGWNTRADSSSAIAELSIDQPADETSQPQTDHIALLTQSVGVEWDTNRNLQAGAGLSAGWLKLKQGTIQVELISGASILIEGPAAVKLISPLKAFCQFGKVRASVPEQAHGFTMETSRLNVVDLGTEFTLSLDQSGSGQVQVIDGKVELHSTDSQLTPANVQSLTTGEGVQFNQWGMIDRLQEAILPLINPEELSQLVEQQQTQQFERWQKQNALLKADPSIVAYYDFEESSNWLRTLNNKSQQKPASSSHGAIVGCQWTSGRWPQKRSLEFKRTSDRVRTHIPGEYQSLTFMAWVRIEGFDRWLSSLMLTDGYNDGNPHWQLSDKGEMILGVKTGPGKNYFSPVVLQPTDLGRWIFLVTVYDHQKQEVVHYLDGVAVSHHEIENPIPLVIGPAEIGNWRPQEHSGAHSIRSLNGRLDEFALFGRALSADEILQLYQTGKPNS
ncbi:LamG domain-containing protein [Gimesia maris]|uniref:LamG domain-containing protein n=1 Tax=Gimesia maris TaxID=122 RepID=UPI00241CFC62|nr:LamG domain-containing protein [Gimesia maris]|tara:strand:- start:118148 stop:119797 length:1650 start_codon:yes stop_codon:yes gene_type:complete